jgi:hypothetical protein
MRAAITAPVLDQPANESSTSDRTPTFSWFPVTGATSYTLLLYKSGSTSTLVLNVNVVGNSYTPLTNLAPGTYYWTVRALGPNGPSLWSASFNLLIN